MDGDSDPAENGIEGVLVSCEKKRPLGAVLVRCAFTVIFSLTASFLLSFFFGLAAIALGTLSNTSAVFVPTECRILSSGVDLRTSRHCGLSLSTYKTTNILNRPEKARAQCRDEYYWASIFQVEYKDFLSGRNINAIAEAPREALPANCRPNFNTVWLMKLKFKVNETYKCRYAPGTHRVTIFSDEIFNCQARVMYNMEKAKRSLMLFLKYMKSSSTMKVKDRHPLLSMAVGVLTGMLVSICLSIVVRVVCMLKSSLTMKLASWEQLSFFSVRLRHGCLVIAYISAMGWLTMQYSKVIGLKQLLFSSDLWERIVAK